MKLYNLTSLTKVCGVILLPLICLSSLALAQWPRFHGNSLNTGVVPGAQGRSGTFSEMWTFPLAHYTNSSPALADLDDDGLLEVVIALYDLNILYALNGEDGSILWSYPLNEDIPACSSPIIDDLDGDGKPEIVFATHWTVIVLQGESGELAWSKPLTGFSGMSPCTADLDGDGTPEVIVSADSTTAYDGETGTELWTAAGYGIRSYGSAVAEDTDLDGCAEVMVFTSDPEPAFCLLDGTDGSLIWNTPIPSGPPGLLYTPAAAFGDLDLDGYPEIVSCTGNDDLYVMNAVDGSILWSVEFRESAIIASPCLVDIDGNDTLEIIVSLYYTNELRAFTCTGDSIWSANIIYLPFGTPAVADVDGDGILEIIQVSGYPNGAVQIFDAETGAMEWVRGFNSLLASSPAIGDLDGDGYYDFVVVDHSYPTSFIYALSSQPQGIEPGLTAETLNVIVAPNPFVSSASIRFELSAPGYTSIQVFDLSGRMICSLAESELASGQHSCFWDGTNQNGEPVSSGVYICRIQSGDISETASLCLLR